MLLLVVMIEPREPLNRPAKIADSTTVAIDTLRLWDRNPRSIKGDRFNELKERLKRQGQIKPLLVAKDGVTVIGGNMRLRAMKELGIEEVWISQTEAQTDKEIFDLALTDNEEFGYYEQEQVAELALELGLSPLELKSYALSLGEPTTLDLVIDKFGPEVEEDEVPEVDEDNTPISQDGEVYQLGQHRLMCGDSTNADEVSKLMDRDKADMVFTDPPYGYKYESNYQTKHDMLMNDDKFLDFVPAMLDVLALDCPVYVCAGHQTVTMWLDYLKQSFEYKNTIIWKKNNWSMGDLEGAYAGQYELIIYVRKGNPKLLAGRDRDVWEFDREPPTDHPTTKPVDLVARAVRNSARLDGNVLDLFGGSGSTLIACEQTNRICYMMELDPKYCDVIRKRYAKHIGEEESWQEVTPVIRSSDGSKADTTPELSLTRSSD